MFYLWTISFCFFVGVLVTPFVSKLAYYTNATDKPNARKVHEKIMPRLGGLAIYIAFLSGYLVFQLRSYIPNQSATSFLDAYFIASFIMIMTGMLDDMFELPPKPKFIAQFIAALIMVVFGKLMISTIYLPFMPVIELGWLAGPITIIWIVGITNSINLIDGLDGLSAGISAISFATMAILAGFQGEPFVAIMCCLLLGSTFGFLAHNFYPAKIFMGDTGSLFLGFSVSTLSLLGYKNAAFVSFFVPIIVLSIPIFDTLWAIIRRTLNGQSPFEADRGHLHHVLLARNLGHVKSVLILYTIALLFSLTAILYTVTSKFYGLVMLVIAIVIVELIFNITGFFRDKN